MNFFPGAYEAMLSLTDDAEEATIKNILSFAAEAHGFTFVKIRDHNRAARVAEVRHLAVWMAFKEGFGLTAIGRVLRRNHATIFHSIKKVSKSPKRLDRGADLLTCWYAKLSELEGRK